MNNEKILQNEIIRAVRGELRSFKGEIREELGSFRDEIKEDVKNELDLFRGEVREELGSFRGEIRGELGSFRGEFDSFRTEVNERFDSVDEDLGRLEVMIGEVDDKFSLITEGQDLIREVLETRVMNIEEILGVENRV